MLEAFGLCLAKGFDKLGLNGYRDFMGSEPSSVHVDAGRCISINFDENGL